MTVPIQPPTALRPSNPPSTAVSDLATVVAAELIAPESGVPAFVTGVELRAQAIQAGDLFAALPGARAHGAEFAASAIEQGATAVLTDPAGAALIRERGPLEVPILVVTQPRSVLGAASAEIYGHPSQHMQVIGITGTSGKTTTAYLVEAGLLAAGRKPGLIGTIETRIQGRRVPSALTTPEAPNLHAMFAAMLEQGIDTVVMEVSSHALSLGRVDGTRFQVGAFTNLSQDHLDFHETFEDYFAAKGRLFVADSTVRAENSVICIDDEWGVRMAKSAPTPLTVGVNTAADWTAANVSAGETGGQRFDIARVGQDPLPVELRLPGRYNVANALLAVAVCATAGADAATAAAAMATVDVPGRVERVERGQDFLAVVDYAHKPAALEAVIGTLRQHTTGRVAVVVGAGGDRDHGKRPLMGEGSARLADLLVVTDDNPRSEDPAAIRAAVLAGADVVDPSARAEIREIGDRAAAIAAAVQWADAGDVVLIAGKGHETGQEIAGVKQPFDDREVLAQAIDARIGGAHA